MKRLILISIAVLFTYGSFSQGLRLGVTLSPHFDWFGENADLVKSDGSKIGVEGGLVLENYFAENYAIVTGIRIGNYGGNLLYTDSVTIKTNEAEVTINSSTVVKYKLQYITVPIGLKLKTNQIGYFTYYAALGFQPQININAKAKAGTIIDNKSVNKEVGIFNMSYYFGGGIEYAVGGNTAVTLGIVYNNGFIDILPNHGSKEVLNILTIQVGVMF